MAKVTVSDGKSCLLWSDLWNDAIPELNFPELYSFAKKKQISVQEAKNTVDLPNLFHLPLSEEAFAQLSQLQDLLDSIQISEDKDQWLYIWNSGHFSSSKAYKSLSGHCWVHPAFKWLWRSCCQSKHRVFFWLLLKDRLSTRGLLRRRNMELESFNCVLCQGQEEESLHHLFIGCPFAAACWESIMLRIDQELSPVENLEWLRAQINQAFFMEIIILFCWAIWMTRNNLIFRQIQPSVQECKGIFKRELVDLLCRAKRKYFPKIQEWIDARL
jgi:hypothetical protein